MPASATHITTAERVAANHSAMQNLLEPGADAETPEGIKMRFAKSGSAGFGIFYAITDHAPGSQHLQKVLIKGAGPFGSLLCLYPAISI